VTTRDLYQCTRCRRQTSPIAGTIFASTHLPLRLWFRAICAINSKHVPRYLAEFEYRFNRRYDLAAMIPRLTWAAVRTPPMPYRLLKLAEAGA
jgi:hypothetical protein